MPTRNTLVKSLVLLFVNIIIFSIFYVSPINSQSAYEQARQEYSLQLKTYNDSNNDFITAKASYLAFRTATSKTDAFGKTKKYLTDANFLLTKHLFVVKEFGNQINWNDSEINKDEQIALIDEEINYLQNHWNRIQQTTTLEELPPLAEELQDRLDDSLLPKRNKIIATFEIVKINFAHNKFNNIFDKLLTYIAPRISNNNKLLVSNWQSEVERINSKTEKSINLSEIELAKVKIDRSNDSRVKNILKTSNQAKVELQKSKNLFEEILRIL